MICLLVLSNLVLEKRFTATREQDFFGDRSKTTEEPSYWYPIATATISAMADAASSFRINGMMKRNQRA